jgi:methylthioribulose-1-phosphate dehydratase
MHTMGSTSFHDATRAIVAAGRWLDSKGWAPATSGNYSCRLVDGSFAVTVSGRHKGRLTGDDVMRVDGDGASLDGKRPSAETTLHLAIYAKYPDVGAVLHSHSPTGVALTRAYPAQAGWDFVGHEMLKALPGITTHDTRVTLPIVDNSQDMGVIWDAVLPALRTVPAYLIRSHGLYAWGKDMAEAERVIEAVEWLIMAELAEAQFRSGV